MVQLVREEVLEILRDRRVAEPGELKLDTSLVQDLGFDSLAFVDLALRLERRLGLHEFFLQDWIDAEAMIIGRRHTLRSLAAFAESVVTAR